MRQKQHDSDEQPRFRTAHKQQDQCILRFALTSDHVAAALHYSLNTDDAHSFRSTMRLIAIWIGR